MTQPTHRLYHLCIGAVLDSTWQEWFDGLEIQAQEEGTDLTGIIDDQAVLHSILNKIRNFNMDLISVSFEEISSTETKE